MTNRVCGTTETAIEVPHGYTADDVAAAVGGTVVSQVLLNSGKRVVVVRISVAMLTSSFAAQQLPQALYSIEQAAQPVAHLTKVTNKALPLPSKFDVRPIAQAIQRTAPIIGDSPLIKVISRGAATINVFSFILQAYSAIRTAPAKETARIEKTKRKCCDAAHKALDVAIAKAARRFHDASYKTKTGVKRFYGKKRKRS